jgi:Zn-dependent peptidase ImmA (M78 family)/transcriptional regulator with XRE-family HTH domain
MSILDSIPSSLLGERVRLARESAGFNQAAAATALDIARTTLVAIEQGKRRARMPELQRLAHLYETSVNAMLRQESIHVDLVPRFRKLVGASDKDADAAVALMADLARAEVELEDLLGVRRSREYPPERPLLPGDVRAQAEQDAVEVRQRLGLSNRPVTDIVTLLEMELNIRVYVRRIDGDISGVFAYDEKLGACILLNANHPRERRAQSAAHEFGHFMATRSEPEILEVNERYNSREERYAIAFGKAFLTPARAVMQRFQEVTAGSEKFSRRHVVVLAHYFGVSREAIVRRLEELELVREGTWDWFQANGGITDEQARQVLGSLMLADADKAAADRPTTLRLNLLAAEAHNRGLLSEGQLCRLLRLDRVEFRQSVGDLDLEGSGTIDLPNLFA